MKTPMAQGKLSSKSMLREKPRKSLARLQYDKYHCNQERAQITTFPSKKNLV